MSHNKLLLISIDSVCHVYERVQCACACVWPKYIIFFNYVNTANRTALMIGINAMPNMHIKWKHKHKITVSTSMIIAISINTYTADTVFVCFFLLWSSLHAWKCAYNLMWEQTNKMLQREYVECISTLAMCDTWKHRLMCDTWSNKHELWWLHKRWRLNKKQRPWIKKETRSKWNPERCQVNVYDFHHEHWLHYFFLWQRTK